MTNLTPRTESITGTSLSGSTGDSNRTYTLAYTNYYSTIEILVQGSPQHETLDFTITGGVITFINAILDEYVISLKYFTSDTSTTISTGYGYCTTSDVYRTSGITSTEISTSDVSNQILEAETFVCRLTKNIYWKINLDKQTATSGAASTITVATSSWTVNDYADQYVWIYAGTGIGQLRKIDSNDATTLTVDRAWTTNPDNTSKFKVFYVPSDFDPYKDEHLDGNGQKYMYLPYYPVKVIEGLAIGYTPTTVTTSYVYLYEKTGKIQLGPNAQVGYFSRAYPQEVDIQYWYGVDHLPYDIKRLVEVRASINILVQQMGGTFDDPSTVGLPEFNISIGQAYINIEGTVRRLQEEYNQLLQTVKIWPVFG